MRAARGRSRPLTYASNIDQPTWPDGLDCEVVTSKALLCAAAEASRASEREHVTPFIRHNPARFSARTLVAPPPGLADERWTLDYPGDLYILVAVAGKLSPFSTTSRSREVNRHLVRNAEYAARAAADKIVTA